MAGWRIGFAAGNPRMVAALAKIKSYLDYGAFTPIQVAATTALNGPQECVAEIRQRYKDRRDVLIEGLARAGWQVPAPNASMFVWAPLPPDFASLGSLEFCKHLLTEAQGRGRARHRLRPRRRRLRALRPDREPPAPAPGRAQHRAGPAPQQLRQERRIASAASPPAFVPATSFAGRRTVIRVPFSKALSIVMVPPCFSTNERTIARPRPEPEVLRL